MHIIVLIQVKAADNRIIQEQLNQKVKYTIIFLCEILIVSFYRVLS